MKLLLIGLNSRYTHTSLGVYSISKYLNSKNIENEACEYTINDPYESIFYSICEKAPQVVGFSTYIWNINLAIRLARDLKLAFPKIKIIFGGPEAGYSNIEYDCVDKVITGEGEAQLYEYLTGEIANDEFPNLPFINTIPEKGRTVS